MWIGAKGTLESITVLYILSYDGNTKQPYCVMVRLHKNEDPMEIQTNFQKLKLPKLPIFQSFGFPLTFSIFGVFEIIFIDFSNFEVLNFDSVFLNF